MVSDRFAFDSPETKAFAEGFGLDDVALTKIAAAAYPRPVTEANVRVAVGLPPTRLGSEAAYKAYFTGALLPEVQRIAASGPGPASHRPASGGTGRAYARNPLAEELMDASGGRIAASAVSSAPTLFNTGDVPSYTSSGIAPELLMNVPWQARHAVAAAPSQAEAYQMLERYSGPDGAVDAQMFADHPGNHEYAARVQAWQHSAMSDDQIFHSLGLSAAEETHDARIEAENLAAAARQRSFDARRRQIGR
ncbi:hypothetical protein BH10ACT8_BH10ACT8_11230 [soil metagenome]